MNLFITFLRMPWWGFLVVAGLIVWLGTDYGRDSAGLAGEVDAALASPPPMTTDLGPDTRAEPQGLNEVVLRAQVALDQSTELVERTNGIVTSRKMMWVLVDPAASAMPEAVRGFLIVNESARQRTAAWLAEQMVGSGALGPIVKLPGRLELSHAGGTHARKVMRERGYEIAAGEVFLHPFLEGRAVGLESARLAGSSTVWTLYLLAAGVAVIGLIKRSFTAVMARAEAAPAADDGLDRLLGEAAPSVASAAGPVAPGSPIDRLRARQQALAGLQQAPATAAPPAPEPPGVPRPAARDPFVDGPVVSGGRTWYRPQRPRGV